MMDDADGANRFQIALLELGKPSSANDGALAVSKTLATEPGPSSLSICRAISKLTRGEALEVLAYLTLYGSKGVPAAVRIASMLHSHSVAWESISKLFSESWRIRDLSILAVTFGKRVRFARDWTEVLNDALVGNDEAKLIFAAISERREVEFNAEKLLSYGGVPVLNWESQKQFEREPSLGRELDWFVFAGSLQRRLEATPGCHCTYMKKNPGHWNESNWLQEAETGNIELNTRFFRMFSMLIPKRSPESQEHTTSLEHHENTSFAVTPSVRQVFFELGQLLCTGRPIIVEGPHGCGKSAAVARMAHITATGRNVFCGGQANVCFVHMDSATNKDDGGEFSELIGSTVPLPNGSGFQWRPGPIGLAIMRGSWLVLENLDCDNSFGNPSTCAFVSQLAALRPGDELSIGARVKPLRVGVGFRVIATRIVDPCEKETVMRWNPPGGWNLWSRIYFPAISETEQLNLLRARFPNVADCVPRVLRAVTETSSIVRKRGKSHDREPTFREAVNICRRLEFLRDCSNTKLSLEFGLSETLDVLVCWAGDESLKTALSETCASAWSLPVNVPIAMLKQRNPSISPGNESLRIGRSILEKRPNRKDRHSEARLALTKHTCRSLERIAVSVSVGECVLLNGETGTGKTSTLQELARVANKKLIVVNMSRQSDIAELIGGFRPLEVASVLPDLIQRFEYLFCRHMSAKKNADFLDALHKSARNPKHHGRALRLVMGAVSQVPASIRNIDHETAIEWSRVEKMATRLKAMVPERETSNRLLPGNEQPPRKRRRSGEIPQDSGSRRIGFHFVDGVLVRALREGHWILLDEINLAPVEVLDHIVSVLDHKSVIVPNESGESVFGARGFCLFAAMNPPTDFGKRPLAKELRSRMTEFFIEDIEDASDIRVLVSHCLYSVDCSRKNSKILSNEESTIADDIAKFYLACCKLSKSGGIQDSSGKCARFSLRTLSNMLRFFVQTRRFMIPSGDSQRRALFEGAMLAFITPLPRSSRLPVIKLAFEFLLRSTRKIREQKPLVKCMRIPQNAQSSVIAGFPVEISTTVLNDGDEQDSVFVETPAVKKTLADVCRMLTFGADRRPVLLQGPTSVGKTSIISHLARLTGNKLIRINNHEHTDLSEYLGSYVATNTGSLVFQEGPLVQAVRNGFWVVLDELNLAPPEVLESLNRLLDDNKEIRIPETGEVVRAHRGFTLFATQNPPGIYGGRKELSRAFRGRFIEIQVDELPDEDLQEIIERRCRLPKSFAQAMVGVMRKLEVRRRESRLFLGKSGFVTARDLFRWGSRRPTSRLELAIHGFFLLGERARNAAEREIVREILTSTVGVKPPDALSDTMLYEPEISFANNTSDENDVSNRKEQLFKTKLVECMAEMGIASTPHMMRTCTLLYHCACNNEPVLLVGPTGTGKTSACALISKVMDTALLSVNCHRHIESSDFVGGFLPACEHSSKKKDTLFEWSDGPLVQAMIKGEGFLIDEINMADDAVIERLNPVLELGRTLMLPERDARSSIIVAHENFRIYATMNPGGDFGKKELSPALRNRFTEVWIPAATSLADYLPVIRNYLPVTGASNLIVLIEKARTAVQNVIMWMRDSISEYELSLREISAWCSFINRASVNLSVHPLLGFAHGARLVFLDGISVGSSSSLRSIGESIWQKVLLEIPEELKQEALTASFPNEPIKPLVFSSDEQGIRVGSFSAPARRGDVKLRKNRICTTATCTVRNGGRLIRAMSVSVQPILLEGPPGAGKTSLVSALASMLNIPIARMNLSESTEMADLLGGHVPGASSGSFDFRKGELLRAMEAGSWVLLDEMNLASQSVLEGLNSLLDHRRSVYVPELATEVVADRNFRLFAAQNPATEGSGRRGLPRSFLNRFVKVAIEPPSDEDLQVIAFELYPSLDPVVIKNIIQVIRLLRIRFQNSDNGMEFGLRQVLRWCSLLEPSNQTDDVILSVPTPELCFDVVICGALKQGQERDIARHIFNDVFRPQRSSQSDPSIRKVHSDTVRIGCKLQKTGNHRSFSSLVGDTNYRLRTSDTSFMQFLTIATREHWPCIVCSESSMHSEVNGSAVIERFAALNGQQILKTKGGSFQDVDDLLGGFVQQDPESILENFRHDFCAMHNDLLSSALSQKHRKLDSGTSAFQCLERASTLLSNISGGDSFPHQLDKILPSIAVLKELSTVLRVPCTSKLAQMEERLTQLRDMKMNRDLGRRDSQFVWEKSLLVKAIESGYWIILEDANRCPAAVLDRLNPLLEVSRSGNYENVVHEPVLLPEAPPNADGTPAFIIPHSNFRMFFIYEDTSGRKLSRAIIDRSVSIRLRALKSEPGSSTELMLQDLEIFGRKGIADLDLRWEHTLVSNEARTLLYVAEKLKFSEPSQSEHSCGVSSMLRAGYDSVSRLCARLNLSLEELRKLYDDSLPYHTSELFILSSISEADLRMRLSVLSHSSKSLTEFPWMMNNTWDIDSTASNRLDVCIDPVFGLDSCLIAVTQSICSHALLFRFNVLVLSKLRFLLTQLEDDEDSRKLRRDSIFSSGRKHTPVYSSREKQHLPPLARFCALSFRIINHISSLVKDFTHILLSSIEEASLFIPSEECWMHLFWACTLLIEHVRSPIGDENSTCNGAVLMKLMDDAISILFSNSGSRFQDILSNLRCVIAERPKYEVLRSELPLPVNDFAFRTERDLVLLNESRRSSGTASEPHVLCRALVGLSTKATVVDERFKESMERLLLVLRGGKHEEQMPIQNYSNQDPLLWDCFLHANLEYSSIELTNILCSLSNQDLNERCIAPTERRFCNEIKLNPCSNLASQVFAQRCAWISEAPKVNPSQLKSLYLESQISILKVSCAKLHSELGLGESNFEPTLSTSSLLAECFLAFADFPERKIRLDRISSIAISMLGDYTSTHSTSSILSSRLIRTLQALRDLKVLNNSFPIDKMDKCDQALMKLTEELAQGGLDHLAIGPELMKLLSTGLNQTQTSQTQHKDVSVLQMEAILSIISGATRIVRFCGQMENLLGIDPASFATTEANIFASKAVSSIALETACRINHAQKLGGDDLPCSHPIRVARVTAEHCETQSLLSRTRMSARPSDGMKFSEFALTVPTIRDLVSAQSAMFKLLEIENTKSVEAKYDASLRNQLVASLAVRFDSTAKSLELGGDWSHLRDITGQLVLGVRELQSGFLHFVKSFVLRELQDHSSSSPSCCLVLNLLQFPRACQASEDVLLSILSKYKSHKLHPAFHAAILRYIAIHWSGEDSELKEMLNWGFCELTDRWKRKLIVDENDQEVKSSLFVIKEKARVDAMPGMAELQSLEIDEEADFEDLFLSEGQQDVDNLMSDGENEDVTVANNESIQTKEADKETSTQTDVLDPITFWEYHRLCYQASPRGREEIVREKKQSMSTLFNSLSHCESFPILLSTNGVVMGTLAACTLSAKSDEEKYKEKSSSSVGVYNFYKDRNVTQVQRMRDGLINFQASAAKIQETFFGNDGPHPALTLLREAAGRALKAAVHSQCLGTLVPVLENVLRKADEFNRLFATRDMTLLFQDAVAELLTIAHSWRRVEVDSWPNLLKLRSQLAKDRALQWFYYLYDSLVLQSALSKELDIDSIVSTIDQFLRSSPVGEFETRLTMLRSICCQLKASSLLIQSRIYKAVDGLCELYALFLPRLIESVKENCQAIEKKMKDFAKLTSYTTGGEVLGSSTKEARMDKHLEYSRLQSKSVKARKKLHKFCREIDAVLNVSSFDIISKEITRKGFVDLLSEKKASTQSFSSVHRTVPFSNQKLGKLFDSWAFSSRTCAIDCSLFDPKSRLYRYEKLGARMRELARGTTYGSILAVSGSTCTEFRTQVRSRTCELRHSNEAGVQLKQRAFADLLRLLESGGIPQFETPADRIKEKPAYWLGISAPFGESTDSDLANYYFYSAGHRLQRLRAVSDGRVRNCDLSAAESKKILACSSNMFVRSCSERKALGETLEELDRTKHLASELSQFEESSVSPTFDSAIQVIRFVNRVCAIELDVTSTLESAESELRRGERALRDKDTSKYTSMRLRGSLTNSRETVEMLRFAQLHLNSFVCDDSVSFLLGKVETRPLVMTMDLCEALSNTANIGRKLRIELQVLLRSAEQISRGSFLCELLRPIVLFLDESFPVLQVKHSKLAASNCEAVVTKCEGAIEEVLRSAQGILAIEETLCDVFQDSELNEKLSGKLFERASRGVQRSATMAGLIRIREYLSEICADLQSFYVDKRGVSSARAVGCFVNIYLESLVCPFVQAASQYHVNALALLKTLEALFIGISEEGYCRPVEQEEGPVEENIPSNVDGTGFGEIEDGDTSLAKDVSAEVEDEEQLMGTKNETAQDQENHSNNQQRDNMQSGFETQADFDGELLDGEHPDENDDRENHDGSEKGEDLEKTFGDDPGENAVEIDEKLWEPDVESDEQNDDETKTDGAEMDSKHQGSDSTLKARDDPQREQMPKPSRDDEQNQEHATPPASDVCQDNNENPSPEEGESESTTRKANFEVPDEALEQEAEELDGQSMEGEEQADASEMECNDDSYEKASNEDGEEAMTGKDATEGQLDGKNSGLGMDESMQEKGDDPKEDIIDGLADMSVDDDEPDPMSLDTEDHEAEEAGVMNSPENEQIERSEKETDTENLNDEGFEAENQADSADVSNPLTADESTSGGQRTTPAGGGKDEHDLNAVASFSALDGNSTSKSASERNEASKTDSQALGNVADNSCEPASEPNMEAGSATVGRGHSSEDIDPISSEQDPNPFRSCVDRDLGAEWEKCVNVLEEEVREQSESIGTRDEQKSSALNEFADKHDGTSERIALASANEDQHAPLPEKMDLDSNEESDTEDTNRLGLESRAEMEVNGAADVQNSNSRKRVESSKNTEKNPVPSEDITLESQEDAADNIGEHPLISAMKILETEATHEKAATFNVGVGDENAHTSNEDVEEMELVNEGEESSEVAQSIQFRGLWRKLESMTAADSAVLSEQLRLVLEPTVRSGLAGSFRSGKRLEMKKVIDFVASDFRRDRIWQRRIRPAKRSYDVLIAIDNSESMRECKAGALGLAGLVLIMSALSKLEVGRVGLLKFGKSCQVVRQLTEAIHVDESKGADILSHFTFTDKETNVTDLLQTAEHILTETHDTTADEDVQLLFVISDGRLSNRENVRRKLRHLTTRNVLVAFIIVNNGGTADTDIFEAKRAVFLKNGELETLPYMSDYPFEFYTVVNDVKLLPIVLGDALRQWLELMTSRS